jgi:aryl-alcohol dehydrogenase-like predicted oxidoreductase
MSSIPVLPTRNIGDLKVSQIGMGCMPGSWSTDPEVNERGIAAIQAGMSAGINFLDTADIYAPAWNQIGHNERLIAEAIRTWEAPAAAKQNLVIATKGGITRQPGEKWGKNGTLDYLLRAVEASAARLGVTQIDIWQHHRMDPSMSFEDQFENVMALREQGIVKRIGLSNVNAAMLRRAIELGGTPEQGGVVSVQNEFSPRYRQWADVIDICTDNGIAFLPWSPLGGQGFFAQLPTKFQTIAEIATNRGLSPYAVTLAWHLRLSPVVIPIPGAGRPASAIDSASAASFELSDAELTQIQASLPEDSPLHHELASLPAFRD